MIDICMNTVGRANYRSQYPDDYDYELGSDGNYYAAFSFGSTFAQESALKTYVETAANYMPSYMIASDEAGFGTWGDGSQGAFQHFYSPDGKVWCEIGTYLSDDSPKEVICQFCTANVN